MGLASRGTAAGLAACVILTALCSFHRALAYTGEATAYSGKSGECARAGRGCARTPSLPPGGCGSRWCAVLPPSLATML